MDNKLPQHYQNTLHPIAITENDSLPELVNCIQEGLRKLEDYSIEVQVNSENESVFNGQLGN